MSEVTIRARDSAEAMDKVVKKLGKDALILDTRTVDGLVEIRACKPEDQTPPPPANKQVGRTSFAQAHSAEDFRKIFEKRLEAEQTSPTAEPKRAAASIRTASAPRDVAVMNPRQSLTPDPFDTSGGWPALSDVFAHRLREDLSQLESGNLRDGFLGQIMRLHDPLAAAEALNAQRIVVTGPSLTDSVDVAMRLYVQQAEFDDTRRPELVFCSSLSRTDAAIFESKARLVGERVQFVSPEALDLSRRGQAERQIIVVPGAVDVELVGGHHALIVALPMGLHPRRLSHVLGRWSDSAAHVALTQVDQWAPSPEELAVCVAHRLNLSFAVYGSVILDPFRIISPQDIAGWAQTWLSETPQDMGLPEPVIAPAPFTAKPAPRVSEAPRPSPVVDIAPQPPAASAASRPPRTKNFDQIGRAHV